MGNMIRSHRFRVQLCVLALALLCLGAGGGAYAAEEERPCAAEIAAHCKGVKPGGGRILQCLAEHQKELSDFCRNKLEEARKRLMEAQNACSGDLEKFCRDIQPGGGRILKCLKEHVQELSPACSQELKIAMEKARENPQPVQQEKGK